MNLNLHIHMIYPGGVHTRVNGKVFFRNLDPIMDEEVPVLVEAVAQKVMHHLKKCGYLDKDSDVVTNHQVDELLRDYDVLSLATSSSIAGKSAFGPKARKSNTRRARSLAKANKRCCLKANAAQASVTFHCTRLSR